MRKLFGGIIIASMMAVLLPVPSQAQSLPNFVVRAVAEVTAYSDKPLLPEYKIKQGSGVFIDHGGCLLTNSHVVLNLDTDEPVPHLGIRISEHRAKPPELAFEGEVVYVDQALDLAYVCPKGETDVFTHFFERKEQSEFDEVPFGKDVFIMGYPGAGEGTITISPGHIVGFIDNPDTSQWLGTPDLDPELLSLYKADALAGPGISGGLLIDENYQLMGVPFAGSLQPGAFTFILSEEVYLRFEQDLRTYAHEQGLVPPDCVYDDESEYYYRGGLAHYDPQCEMPFDENMDHEVRQTFQAFCKRPISQQRLVPAIRRSKELGSLAAWSDSLVQMCPMAAEESVANEVDLEPGTFAYGKARLRSLEKEQELARELKSIIDEKFPNTKISAENWSTIVNSYIYGGYPVEAIVRAIELGGKTVHPTIPFEMWKKSPDYLGNL